MQDIDMWIAAHKTYSDPHISYVSDDSIRELNDEWQEKFENETAFWKRLNHTLAEEYKSELQKYKSELTTKKDINKFSNEELEMILFERRLDTLNQFCG